MLPYSIIMSATPPVRGTPCRRAPCTTTTPSIRRRGAFAITLGTRQRNLAAASLRCRERLGGQFVGRCWNSPLALCDARSFTDRDLIASDLGVYQHVRGETSRVEYRPEHRWYYFSEQQADEVILIPGARQRYRRTGAAVVPHLL